MGAVFLPVLQGAIAAPSPPNRIAFTAIKFLPFAAMVFGVDRRSTVDPDLLGLLSIGPAGGAAKFLGVNRCSSPVGRDRGKSIHSGKPDNYILARGGYEWAGIPIPQWCAFDGNGEAIAPNHSPLFETTTSVLTRGITPEIPRVLQFCRTSADLSSSRNPIETLRTSRDLDRLPNKLCTFNLVFNWNGAIALSTSHFRSRRA